MVAHMDSLEKKYYIRWALHDLCSYWTPIGSQYPTFNALLFLDLSDDVTFTFTNTRV